MYRIGILSGMIFLFLPTIAIAEDRALAPREQFVAATGTDGVRKTAARRIGPAPAGGIRTGRKAGAMLLLYLALREHCRRGACSGGARAVRP